MSESVGMKMGEQVNIDQLVKLKWQPNQNEHYEVPARPPDDRLMTVQEVAKVLCCSDGFVRQHATRSRPRIPCVKIGSLLRFCPKDVAAFIRENRK